MPWVVREPGSGTRAVFEAAMAGLGLRTQDLDVVLELPSNEAVRTAIEAGRARRCCRNWWSPARLSPARFIALDLALPTRQFLMLSHKERTVTNAERELYRLIER